MIAPTSGANETPFADLTPQAVLDALDAVGLAGDGRMIQLNSYENRVFQVFLESGEVWCQFYRRALERRPDSRGARLRGRTCGARDPRRRAARARGRATAARAGRADG
jgi:hypothetical protein